jgi:hypothetical protein
MPQPAILHAPLDIGDLGGLRKTAGFFGFYGRRPQRTARHNVAIWAKVIMPNGLRRRIYAIKRWRTSIAGNKSLPWRLTVNKAC